MRNRVHFALILGLLTAPASAAELVAAPVAKLVEQLGSNDFNEREQASAALDAVGEPALDALRQAVQSTDEEVRKRAETLVRAIEKRVETTNALKAKRVHLVYKDTPLKEAVADFEKKTGYSLPLYVPRNKLDNATVTLDTGDASFWRALDQFCDKAGLKEGETQNLVLTELADGKAGPAPVDDASALRIRMGNKADPSGAPRKDELAFALQLALEPRLDWSAVQKATITKAVDDQEQELAQSADPPPAVNAPDGGTPGFMAPGSPVIDAGRTDIHRIVRFRLKKGVKDAKALTDLRGTVCASILTEAAPIITAPDILKAAGKTFTGGDNGQLKVIEASRNESRQITIRVELQAPADVASEIGGPFGRGAGRRIGRGLPVAVAPAAGVVVIHGSTGAGPDGIRLLDDNGGTIKATGVKMQFTAVAAPAGIVNSLQHIFTFQAEKGQEPSKLVYYGRKLLNVEIPFALKDVPLP